MISMNDFNSWLINTEYTFSPYLKLTNVDEIDFDSQNCSGLPFIATHNMVLLGSITTLLRVDIQHRHNLYHVLARKRIACVLASHIFTPLNPAFHSTTKPFVSIVLHATKHIRLSPIGHNYTPTNLIPPVAKSKQFSKLYTKISTFILCSTQIANYFHPVEKVWVIINIGALQLAGGMCKIVKTYNLIPSRTIETEPANRSKHSKHIHFYWQLLATNRVDSRKV